jgi:hypothetical protein
LRYYLPYYMGYIIVFYIEGLLFTWKLRAYIRTHETYLVGFSTYILSWKYIINMVNKHYYLPYHMGSSIVFDTEVLLLT